MITTLMNTRLEECMCTSMMFPVISAERFLMTSLTKNSASLASTTTPLGTIGSNAKVNLFVKVWERDHGVIVCGRKCTKKEIQAPRKKLNWHFFLIGRAGESEKEFCEKRVNIGLDRDKKRVRQERVRREIKEKNREK
jgi:hypothetical protein